jgi:hypothetical protein
MRVALVLLLAGCTDWASFTAGNNDSGGNQDLSAIDMSMADLSASTDMGDRCSDGIQDGDESAIDCGGSCPARCAVDKTCLKNADCASAVCDTTAGRPGNCIFATNTPSWIVQPVTDVNYIAHWQIAAVELSDGTIMVLGGRDTNNNPTATAFVFNPQDLSVTALNDMNRNRERFAAVVIGGKTYAIGGTDDGFPGQKVESNAAMPAFGNWNDGPANQSTGSHGMGAATISAPNVDAGTMDRVFIVGGRDTSAQQVVTGSVRSFTPTSAIVTGTDEPSLLKARTNLSVVAFENKLWAIGGNADATAPGGTPATFKDVETFMPGDAMWQAHPANLSTGRTFGSAVVAPDGRIYMIGGLNYGSGDYLPSVEAFSPTLQRWVKVASLNTARARHAAALGGDGRIYVFGGYNVNNIVLTVEAYGPSITVTLGTNPPTMPVTATIGGTNFAADATITACIQGTTTCMTGITDSGGVISAPIVFDVSSQAGNTIKFTVQDDKSQYPVTSWNVSVP